MDVMALRRMLMTIGGGSVAVGDFTQYEQKTLTFPNAEDVNDWTKGAIVPCSFEPKLIMFWGGDNSRFGTVKYGVFAFDLDGNPLGVVAYRNSAGTNTFSAYVQNVNAGSSRFKYDSGTFYACRPTGGSYWQPEDSYTFDIYG